MLDVCVLRRKTRVIHVTLFTMTLYSRGEVRPSRQQRKSLCVCYTSLSFRTRSRKVLRGACDYRLQSLQLIIFNLRDQSISAIIALTSR